jgi:hypothetical protein
VFYDWKRYDRRNTATFQLHLEPDELFEQSRDISLLARLTLVYAWRHCLVLWMPCSLLLQLLAISARKTTSGGSESAASASAPVEFGDDLRLFPQPREGNKSLCISDEIAAQ